MERVVLIKAITVFGLSYGLLMSIGIALVFGTIGATGASASPEVMKNVGFILNMTVLASAIALAVSRQVHEKLGSAPGPLAFRRILIDNRVILAAGFGVLAVAVDLGLHLLSSAYFTGSGSLPPLSRIAVLAAIYSGVAWAVISYGKASLHGRR